VLLGDAAFQKRSAELATASNGKVKLVTTYTSARVENRPNDPLEATKVRSHQSLRAPVEHAVGRLNGPAGYGFLRKRHRPENYQRVEKGLSACMSIENIARCLETDWPIPNEPQALYFDVLDAGLVVSPWVEPPSSRHEPGGLRFSAEVERTLVAVKSFSSAWTGERLHELKEEWNVEGATRGGKCEQRAREFLNGPNVRFAEMKTLPDGSIILLYRVRASAKDVSYFAAVHYSCTGQLLHHGCTCSFGGNGAEMRARKAASDLAVAECKLASGDYVPRLPDLDQARLSSMTLQQLKQELQSRKMLLSGNKEQMTNRLLAPGVPSSYPHGVVPVTEPYLQDEVARLRKLLVDTLAIEALDNRPWCAHQFSIPLSLSQIATHTRRVAIGARCPPPFRQRAKVWPLWYLEEVMPALSSFLLVSQRSLGADDMLVCSCGSFDDGMALHVCAGCQQSFHLKCLKKADQTFNPESDWRCSYCKNGALPKGRPRQLNCWEDVVNFQRDCCLLGLQATETQLARVRLYAQAAGAEAHHIMMRQGPDGLQENDIEEPEVAEQLGDLLDSQLVGNDYNAIMNLLDSPV
jgi:hypothetical protein